MEHKAHLGKDKKLKKIIDKQETKSLAKRNHIHLELCGSIMSQQLSTKVAAVIYQRFLNLFESKNLSPQDILSIPFDELRAIGLSNSKTHYVRNVCEFFIEQKLKDKSLHNLSNEDIIEKLITIKGVGRWTIEMLLMFTMAREDVFAVDDLGIQQAMTKLYNIDTSDKKHLRKEMIRISEKWSPYRTYACLYLWAWKDEK